MCMVSQHQPQEKTNRYEPWWFQTSKYILKREDKPSLPNLVHSWPPAPSLHLRNSCHLRGSTTGDLVIAVRGRCLTKKLLDSPKGKILSEPCLYPLIKNVNATWDLKSRVNTHMHHFAHVFPIRSDLSKAGSNPHTAARLDVKMRNFTSMMNLLLSRWDSSIIGFCSHSPAASNAQYPAKHEPSWQTVRAHDS